MRKAATTYTESDVSVADLGKYIRDIKYFDNTMYGFDYLDAPEITLYRGQGNGFMCGFVDIPTSIFPGVPAEDSDWDDYARSHMDLIYNYLSEKGTTLCQ